MNIDLESPIGKFQYQRIGHDARGLELLEGGRVGVGAAGMEQSWEYSNGELRIIGESGRVTCNLRLTNGSWEGRWTQYERMPVRLIPYREPEYVNGVEIRVIATRRSGHHAICNWILSMIPGTFLFRNDLRPGKDPFDIERPLYFPRVNYLGFDFELEKAGLLGKKDYLVFNMEDQLVDVARQACFEKKLGRSKKRIDILVLRDAINNWASLVSAPFSANRKVFLDSWIDHAHHFLSPGDLIPVNFNKWAIDESYRRSIAEKIELDANSGDSNTTSIFGGGSSFSGVTGGRGDVTRRWEKVRDNPRFWHITTEKELWETNSQIFGDVFGGEIQDRFELTHQALEKARFGAADQLKSKTMSGNGIVTCGGGEKYFPCVWVLLKELRANGCEMPVEVWCLPEEIGEHDRALLEGIEGVKVIDAGELPEAEVHPNLEGWELKTFAMIHSRFANVLFLDADNVPVIDPSSLFESPEFAETGAVFWPDFNRLEPDRKIWDICGLKYRDEPEFETGQMLIDKKRCWEALVVADHMNRSSQFYYDYIHGDKETFHMAWHLAGVNYGMPNRGIDHVGERVMCQHWFDGTRIFQHRNLAKWVLPATENPRIEGFLNEDRCLEHLAALEKLRS